VSRAQHINIIAKRSMISLLQVVADTPAARGDSKPQVICYSVYACVHVSVRTCVCVRTCVYTLRSVVRKRKAQWLIVAKLDTGELEGDGLGSSPGRENVTGWLRGST